MRKIRKHYKTVNKKKFWEKMKDKEQVLTSQKVKPEEVQSK